MEDFTPQVYKKDNLAFLNAQEDGYYDLIYIDPPFNTGKVQKRKHLMTSKVAKSGQNDQNNGHYQESSYNDKFDDYLGFLEPRIKEAYRVLKDNGSLFFHIDYREVHYCKVLIDTIFGRESFKNEIIWSYDYGGRSKTKWSCKHDTILWYTKNPKNYTYNYDQIDRIPYLAPSLVGPEKAAKGKTPTDCWTDSGDFWWHTIVPTNGKEKVGYATQKPLGILNRIVKVHSNPGDLLLDFFAGSGSFGQAAMDNGRRSIMVDSSEEAYKVMKKRFGL